MRSAGGALNSIRFPRFQSNQELEFSHLLGLLIEFLLFGIYILSFSLSLIIARSQKRRHTVSTKIFVLGNLFLFLIATIHASIGLARIIQAFVTDSAGPYEFLNCWDCHNYGENVAFYVLIFFSMNVADVLAIYRCYIIWSRNIYVVALPIILALSSYAVGITLAVGSGNMNLISIERLQEMQASLYPIHFSQNITTTSLMIWRLWRQHRASAKAGVRTLGASLVQTAWIIVESAMVYTIILLALIVLDLEESNALYTVQYALVPSIGITFNLISIRAYLAQVAAASRMPNTSILPQFHTISIGSPADIVV